MNIYITLITIIILLIINREEIQIQWYKFYYTKKIKSDLDNMYHTVVNIYPNYKEAADLLAELNLFSLGLIKKLNEVYINPNIDKEELLKGYIIAKLLSKNFKSENLIENDSILDDGNFTQNKGEIIAILLRKHNKDFFEMNQIKFVMLHELSHMVTKSINHDKQFWENFHFLYNFCNKYNLYTSTKYKIVERIYGNYN